MTSSPASLLARVELDTTALWREHPPQLRHRAKAKLLALAGGLERSPSGTLVVSRWAPSASLMELTLPERTPVSTSIDGAFDYAPPHTGSEAWWMNFANTHLFCAYGAAAFAQDELQVAEHPILGSVLEALSARRIDGLAPLTREGDRPTPITIRGAERWCTIDTDPELAMPYGIYGRRLERASDAVLAQAVTRLPSGAMTNVLAMEAPAGGHGAYQESDVRLIVETAIAGFGAARAESREARVVVHTGHWGTGAYGGDRVLMAIAQIVAARFAVLDELAYHSLDDAGLEAHAEASRIVARSMTTGMSVAEVVREIVSRGFTWGTSDGS
jgi:hypothetical protein